MNYYKESLIDELCCLCDELICDDADSETINIISKAKDYISEMPVIYDRDTVIKAIACHACQGCDIDFNINRRKCKEQYNLADMMFENSILDEHDEYVLDELEEG